jgi:serine/threonine protein phosphatase PrpC
VYIAKRLTYDHRAEDEGEQKRIQDAGGFIARGRVLGILAVTRSFGDHGMKEFVTAQPYITTTILGSEESGSEITHPFLILACDGVWDVFTDQEAVDFVNEKLEANGGEMCTDAAECLVQASIDRGSADNITAIVIYL